MKAIVLAGGLGTRLRERIPDLPKVMAPVAGRPFLEHVLDRLVASGVAEIVLSLGYKAEIIANHFGHSYKNVVLDYSIETEPLGTGGAILHAARGRDGDPFLALNGDTLLDLDYGEFIGWYTKIPVPIAMVLRTAQDVARYGSVLTSNGSVVGFMEKGKTGPGLINAGVYIVQPDIFRVFHLSGKFSFEIDLLQPHCNVLKPRAFVTDAYFIDIGVPEDYDRAQYELA